MPVDVVRYSTGGEQYSEAWPVMALFEKLIRDKYKGQIYFQLFGDWMGRESERYHSYFDLKKFYEQSTT